MLSFGLKKCMAAGLGLAALAVLAGVAAFWCILRLISSRCFCFSSCFAVSFLPRGLAAACACAACALASASACASAKSVSAVRKRARRAHTAHRVARLSLARDRPATLI